MHKYVRKYKYIIFFNIKKHYYYSLFIIQEKEEKNKKIKEQVSKIFNKKPKNFFKFFVGLLFLFYFFISNEINIFLFF
jgi:hypothetical protein